ncbi:MAG: hypothetical protein ACRCYQ_11615 [Nocardioides sp.]
MSETQRPEPTEAAPERPAPSTVSRLGVLALAIVFLALLLGVRWWYNTTSTLREIDITASAPSCSDAQVSSAAVQGEPVRALTPTSGAECEIVITVLNPTRATVTVSRLLAPGLGPDSRVGMRAVQDERTEPLDKGSGPNAAYVVESELGPDGFLELIVAYEYSAESCPGTGFEARNWPAVEVEMTGRTRTAEATRPFSILPGC